MKKIKIPNEDHPITIEPAGVRVQVRLNGAVVADTHSALTLRESDYPAVYYIPRADVDAALLERSATESYCPYKGDASYYNVAGAKDVIWSYEHPYDAVAQIRGYLAFYPDRVDAIEELPIGA